MESEFFLSRCKREFKASAIVLTAPDRWAAEGLRRCCQELAQWAFAVASRRLIAKGREMVLLDWVGNNGKPYEIPVWLASSLAEPSEKKPKSTPLAEQILASSIYTSQPNIPLPLLRKMAIAAESDRPISIVRQHDKKQICINQPMETLLATPAPQACERIMTNFWRPRDLEELERKYRQEGTFTWRYEGGLNETTWALLEGRFERFEGNDGNWYGFVTNFYSEPVPYPEDMKLLRR